MKLACTWVVVLVCALPLSARADLDHDFDQLDEETRPAPPPPADSPARYTRVGDEPRLIGRATTTVSTPSGWGDWWLRTEVAFGWSSLVVDPDIDEGYGGGLFITAGFHRRVGLELSVYFAENPFNGKLGEPGSTFLSGNISFGPVVRLLDPAGRLQITLEAGMGFYLIPPPPILQDPAWTLGIYGGGDLSFRIFSWLGVGFKLRYQLFNLTTVSGSDLRDIKSFQTMGVVDRLDLPVYLSFHY